MAADADGNVYVAQAMSQTQSRIVKLSSADGSLDAAFSASAPFIGQLAVHGEALYATGGWPLAGGGNRLARLSLVSGAIDTAYVPAVQLTFGGFAIDPLGVVYVATTAGLRRVLRNGGVDPLWSAASSFFIVAMGIGPNHLFVATQAASTSDPSPVFSFSLANGAADTAWNATTNGRVRGIEADSQGGIWLGGEFTRVNGVDNRYLARLGQTGVLLPGGTPAPDNFVYTLGEFGGGMAAGGFFERLDAQPRLGVARIALNGALLPDSISVELEGSARALARQPNGGVIVGGSFSKVGHLFTSNAARFNADGSLDMGWRSEVSLSVFAVAVDSSGSVFLGGLGAVPAGVAKLRGDTGATITAWSPALTCSVVSLSVSSDGWLHVGAVSCPGASRLRRVRADSGVVDTSWPATSVGSSSVQAIVDDGQGSLYVTFGTSVARLSAATGQTTWRLRTGSGSLSDLALSGGDLFVGGNFCGLAPFEQPLPPATPPCFLARVASSTGAVVAPWSANLPDRVFGLAITASGELVVSGFDFLTDDIFDNRGVSFLKKLRPSDGSTVPDWDPRPNSTASALLVDSPESIWIGGSFNKVGGVPRLGLAALPTAGAPPLPASNILFDSRRDGHGIEFVRVRDSLYALTFYTYGADGQPEWYQALGNVVNGVFAPTPDANGKSLFRYRYVPGASPPQQQLPALSGTVSVDFNAPATRFPCNDGRNATNAVAVMTFSLGADQNVRWCMEPIVAANARAATDYSGLWFAGPADDGWGWSVLNFRLAEQNGLAAILFYYDGLGNSSFAFAQTAPFVNAAPIPVFHRRGYCRTCPTIPFVDQPAGSVTFMFTQPSEATSANNRVSYSVSPQNSVGSAFARTSSPFVLLTSPQ